MRIKSTYILPLFFAAGIAGCEITDPEFLDREPTSLLLEEQVWSDPKLVQGLLANFYDRVPQEKSLSHNPHGFARLDEAMWSGYNNDPNTMADIPYGFWGIWDYHLIRDLNQFIQNAKETKKLTAQQRAAFAAEARFLRAYTYFEMVKRMGGVPLITERYEYDFSGNPAYLQFPRATEAEVYDFIASEIDAIRDELPANTNPARATKWAALALKSRAMLYAGSIAKYNNLRTPQIRTPGGEVGIPADRAADYFQKSLAAAQEIIRSGKFQLYNRNPDRAANFYEAIVSKQNNPEVIWAEDYTLDGKFHNFTYENIARSLREDNQAGSALSPSLNLVESFEYLDGSSGELKTRTADGEFVCYANPEDVFAGKDARLAGTIIYPGSSFKGKEVSIQAGVMVWDEATQKYKEVTSNVLGSKYSDGGVLVGADGPVPSEFDVTNTGFYLRKFVDSRPGSARRGEGTDVWWIRYRYAETLLNAAEAAFELGQQGVALTYVNQLRERAGFGANSLSSLTMDRLRNERRVELAFEDHRFYDVKRWRLAHEVWNGDAQSPDAVVQALWPYRVVRSGHVCDGQYVFVEKVAPRFREPRFFRLGNYYSEIGNDILSANPKIVRNPFH
jgi:hypothetical protein